MPSTDSPPTSSARGADRPTIAVVAVHGVGEHAPSSSAHSVADLLLRLQDRDAAQYTAFHERPLRVPTKPAVVHPEPHSSRAEPVRRSIFTEQSAYVLEQQTKDAVRRSDAGGLPEHQFMRAQLEHYRSSGTPYETVRLEGERLNSATPGAVMPEAGVHVYEMYWSDLSTLGSGGIGFFGAFYQLLFHLAHLGRIAVDHARIEFNRSVLWRVFGVSTEWCVRLLTIFVPAVWLAMLATILSAVVLQLGAAAKPYVIVAAAGAALVALGIILAYQTIDKGKLFRYPYFPIFSIVATAVVAYFVFGEPKGHAAHIDQWLLAVWLALACGILYMVYRAYERVRPGALKIGMTTYAISAIAMVAFVIWHGTPDSMFAGSVRMFEIETAAIMGIWYLVYVTGCFSALAGFFAAGTTPREGGQRDRGAAAAWTARTTLASSASMVLVVTFVMWAAILLLTRSYLPSAPAITPVVPLFTNAQHSAVPADTLFTTMLRVTSGPGFAVLAYVLCGVALVAFIALVPAVIKEVFPPTSGARFDVEAGPDEPVDAARARKAQARDDRASARLGAWLSGGLSWVGWAAGWVFFPTFIAMPVLNVWLYASSTPPNWLFSIGDVSLHIILTVGGALTATAVGLIAFRNRLDSLALGFRPALDAALDVDNYLREHPRTSTPRARIAERYTSLLRYLCHWRDDAGQPYGAIVLVTHSQGTVISADLLNFVEREHDPELDRLRVGDHREPALYLFTMGSPLRQLYAEAFPHLFGWIRGDSSEWFSASTASSAPVNASAPPADGDARGGGHVVGGPAIGDAAAPDPWRIGATRWVNAYRSGDYVGRSLWRLDMHGLSWRYQCAASDFGTTPATGPVIEVTEDARRSRRELCIGAGAHTHYWDETAKAIASELDLLIAEAADHARRARGMAIGAREVMAGGGFKEPTPRQ